MLPKPFRSLITPDETLYMIPPRPPPLPAVWCGVLWAGLCGVVRGWVCFGTAADGVNPALP